MPRHRIWWSRVGAGLVALVALTVSVSAFVTDPAPTNPTVTPADGAGLPAPPTEVSVTFTGRPAGDWHLSVATVDGVAVTTGVPHVVGQSLVTGVDIDTAGEFVVAYHVLLADGSQASGMSRFTVIDGLTNTTDPNATGTPTWAPRDGPVPAASGHRHIGDDPLSLGLLALAAVMVIAVVTLLLRRPRAR